MRGALSPIVQTVVVEHKIAGCGIFEDETLDPKINHVKFHVFGKPAGGPIMESSHPTMQVSFALPFPWVKGTLLPFVSSPLSYILISLCRLARSVYEMDFI
jgi:hypothetical protein